MLKESYTVQAAGRSHQGLVRDQNEDRFVIDQSIGFYLVADGIGGHQAGEVASRIAAEIISKKIARCSKKSRQDPAKFLEDAISTAHQAIRKQASKTISQQGMGSTVVVAWLDPMEKQLWLAHVGDSRAYLLRGIEFLRLTEDHTIYNQAKRAGLLGDDPLTHPPRSVLSQALGASAVIAPETARIDLQPNDRLLLCSDGLTDMLSDEQISELMHTEEDLDQVCERLIQSALDRGGKDNVSVVLLHILSNIN
jgi:serine/threonine protein phosphatase PrpC